MGRDKESLLSVEVLAPPLAAWAPGRLREWSQAREEYYRLLQLLDTLSGRFKSRIVIYLVDPFSLQGLFKVARYRIRRFPTFLIGGERYTGWDAEELGQRIERHLARLSVVPRGPNG
jgi:hypothetical protein